MALRFDLGYGSRRARPVPYSDVPFHPQDCPAVDSQIDGSGATLGRPNRRCPGRWIEPMYAATADIRANQACTSVIPHDAVANRVLRRKDLHNFHPVSQTRIG